MNPAERREALTLVGLLREILRRVERAPKGETRWKTTKRGQIVMEEPDGVVTHIAQFLEEPDARLACTAVNSLPRLINIIEEEVCRVDPPGPIVYTVKAGDTLQRIGASFDTPWRRIAEVNRLDNPDYIRPGWRLVIPKPTEGEDGA